MPLTPMSLDQPFLVIYRHLHGIWKCCSSHSILSPLLHKTEVINLPVDLNSYYQFHPLKTLHKGGVGVGLFLTYYSLLPIPPQSLFLKITCFTTDVVKT